MYGSKAQQRQLSRRQPRTHTIGQKQPLAVTFHLHTNGALLVWLYGHDIGALSARSSRFNCRQEAVGRSGQSGGRKAAIARASQ